MRYASILTLFFIQLISFDCLAQMEALNEAWLSEDFEKVIEVGEECIKIDSTNLLCHERMALAAYKLGDFKTSKTAFNKILEQDSIHRIALENLARIYELEENIPKAIRCYNVLVSQDSSNAIYYRKLGQLYVKAEFNIEAKNNFEKAYAINAKDFFTVKGLVEIHLANEEFQLADELIENSLAYDSTNLQLILMSARSAYIQKEYQQTVKKLEGIRGKLDLNNYYSKMLGFSYLQIDSIDKSITYLTKSLFKEKNPEYALYYLAIAHEEKNEFAQAIEFYEKAKEAGISKQVDNYYKNLGRLYKQEGNLPQAIKNYERAYDHSKDDLLVYLLAQVTDEYYKDKKVAIRYYRKFEKSAYPNQEYKAYARQRRIYLKEQMHLMNSNE